MRSASGLRVAAANRQRQKQWYVRVRTTPGAAMTTAHAVAGLPAIRDI